MAAAGAVLVDKENVAPQEELSTPEVMPPSPSTVAPESALDENSPTSTADEDSTPKAESEQPSSPTSKAEKAALQQKLRDNAVLLQLTKTKMCAFFQRGRCASKDCRYAHSEDELRPPPNLHKTKMCRAFMQGNCTDENCVFAHGDGDLRVTQGIYKTQMCNFFERGYCKKGERCNHAHGSIDLRPPRKPADPFAPAVALNKAVSSSPTAAKAAPAGPLTPGAVAPGKENAAPAGTTTNPRQRQKMALADLITQDNEANIANMQTPSAMSMPSPNKSVVELASMAFSPVNMPSSPLWGYGGSLFPPSVATPTAHGAYDSILGPYDPVDVLLDHMRVPQMTPQATPTSLISTGLPLTTPPPPPPLPPQLPHTAAQFGSPFASVADFVAPAPGLELQNIHHSSAACQWHTPLEAPALNMPFGWMSGLEHTAATPTAQDAAYLMSTPTATPLAKRDSLDPVAVNLSDKLSRMDAGSHQGLSIFTPEKAALPKTAEASVGGSAKKPHKTIKL